MSYADPAVIDFELIPDSEPPKGSNPSLLGEARIKADRLRTFLEETVEELEEGAEASSQSMIRDYNGLRALVIEASPRLATSLPPEILLLPTGSTQGFAAAVVTNRELLFFCSQIKDLLDHRGDEEDANASSVFGPNGVDHDPVLVAVARSKAKSLLDHVQKQASPIPMYDRRVPISLLDDYDRLLALIREAAPGLVAALPPHFRTSPSPKPKLVDEPGPSLWSSFVHGLLGHPRPRRPKFTEFLYHCQQLARLLK